MHSVIDMLLGPALVSAILSGVAVAMLIRVAPQLCLMDRPEGRKNHSAPVPMVGGLAIFVAFVVTGTVFVDARATMPFYSTALLLVALGTWDDTTSLTPRFKFAVVIAACGVMITAADVQLTSLGNLLGGGPLQVGWLSVPLTIFAAVGVTNAINMIDGLDGLAGSIVAIALTWYTLVAAEMGLALQASLSVILAGAVGGFLLFNLRLAGWRQARAFLGDAGSLMLGFALSWFAIELTQGPMPRIAPITALWIVMLPIADCVSVMTRRLRARRSPFVADHEHIHHYLLARGFTHKQTLAILTGLSTLSGAVGYFAWKFDVPQTVLFWAFCSVYFAYHFWIGKAWSKLHGTGHPATYSEDVQALIAKKDAEIARLSAHLKILQEQISARISAST